MLAAQAELGDDVAVALNIAVLHVVEHAATTTNEHQETTTAVVILLVHLEVIGEVIDTSGEQCDLDFG